MKLKLQNTLFVELCFILGFIKNEIFRLSDMFHKSSDKTLSNSSNFRLNLCLLEFGIVKLKKSSFPAYLPPYEDSKEEWQAWRWS